MGLFKDPIFEFIRQWGKKNKSLKISRCYGTKIKYRVSKQLTEKLEIACINNLNE